MNDDIPAFNLFDSHNQIFTRARLLPPSKVSNTLINKTLVADGCIVFAEKLENSLIGIRSRIGEGSTLKNCYMMGADFYETLGQLVDNQDKGIPKIGIGNYSSLENCIIDKNTRIGNHVIIRGGTHIEDQDNDLFTVRDEIAGLQYKVEKDQKLFVNRLQGEAGDAVTFDKVLLINNGAVTVGAPSIKGASVGAKILDQVKGDKVIVFKKKRRKGYRVKNGHRQQFTQIQIVSI
ncbi:unnamed protein product, partial [Darwinula stevensoni]